MTMWHSGILCLLLMAPGAMAQYRVQYKCVNDGKYTVRFNDGPDHYCWDRVYYSNKNAPPEVREYFANIDREMADVGDRMEALRRSIKGSQADSPRTTSVAATGGVPASRRPAPKPLDPERFAAIKPGATRAQVLAALGNPHGQVAGLDAGRESWSYLIAGRGRAKVELTDGKVTTATLPD